MFNAVDVVAAAAAPCKQYSAFRGTADEPRLVCMSCLATFHESGDGSFRQGGWKFPGRGLKGGTIRLPRHIRLAGNHQPAESKNYL